VSDIGPSVAGRKTGERAFGAIVAEAQGAIGVGRVVCQRCGRAHFHVPRCGLVCDGVFGGGPCGALIFRRGR